MIITTIPKKNYQRFGKFFFTKNNETKIYKDKQNLMIIKGYLYPDLKLSFNDLFKFLKKGYLDKSIRKFKGRYCGCFITKNNITIFNDQLGLNDIFYYFKDNKLIISDRFVDILNSKRFRPDDLDKVALAEFLIYNHPLIDRTFIKPIKILPYAALKSFNITNGQAQEVKYWRYRFKPKMFNEKKAFKQLDKLLKKSITRIRDLNPNKTFTIGLSGGLDSRLVARYALDNHINLKPFVFGHTNPDTFIVSRRISKLMDLKLKELRIKDDYWGLKYKHMNLDPMMNVMHTAYSSISNEIPEADVMLTGFYGGELFGNHMVEVFGKSTKRNRYLIKKGIIDKKMIKEVKRDLRGYTDLDLSDLEKSQIFDFENRQLRFIKNIPAFSYYGAFKSNFSIFCDIDLVEFILTIPLSKLKNCSFYHNFYKTYFPELARIRPESRMHSLYDSPFKKNVKEILLNIKFRIINQFGIRIPIFDRIRYNGAMDWRHLFSKIDLEKELADFNIPGFQLKKVKGLNNSIPNISLKFGSITIKNFIEKYISL